MGSPARTRVGMITSLVSLGVADIRDKMGPPAKVVWRRDERVRGGTGKGYLGSSSWR